MLRPCVSFLRKCSGRQQQDTLMAFPEPLKETFWDSNRAARRQAARKRIIK